MFFSFLAQYLAHRIGKYHRKAFATPQTRTGVQCSSTCVVIINYYLM